MSDAIKRRRAVRMGVVTSDKMDKSVVVRVERTVKHKVYKRYVRRSTTFMAHDEKNECRIGDTVEIIESRPLSARKRWRVSRIVRKATGTVKQQSVAAE
ncbi:MAG: 30S ribosomal protein S17 [Acidobacteria bacterium]|nr:30S ribosomal protein S17 [Acidobacteriota bacterium]NIM60809.1 30S ribosomal protein S17 [Acidobacteriota bacterium]NIQ83494.1 30S ribosomal protein S17 [Acidobacteriota bacterium]NIT09735.1 30S ribosomal protein S17 [Acidobacteriota bacterium]